MLEEIINLLREQPVLPNVVNTATNRPCASGGSVSTWAVDGTGRTIFPPVGFPTRGSEHLPGSPCQWTYAGGPDPGGEPETYLRAEAEDQAGSLQPNPEVDPVRPRSPNDREILEPDENPRRHTVRLVSPGARRNPHPNSGRSRTDQSETAAGRFRSRSPVLPSCKPPICVPTCAPTGVTRIIWSPPLSGDGSRTNRPQLREILGALNPEFTFACSTTRGHVSRHATTSPLAKPVFDRRRIGAESSETFDWPFGPGKIQAIDGHHFTQCEVYPRRTPAAAAGSARQSDTDNNNLFLPFSCSGDNNTTHIAYGDRLEYSYSDDDDTWSSVDGQYTDQTPQPVAVQPEEQCNTMSHSERVILARTFLCDELPATDSLVPRTVPCLSALAQADYNIPVVLQPGFPFSEAMINHFQKIQQELQTTPGGKSHRFVSVPRSREATYSPLESSSTGFLFSRDSPVGDKSFTEISRSQVEGTRLGSEQNYFRDLTAMTRRRLCISSFQHWSGAALNRSVQ
ncbi:hypothetical protein NP493_7646g00001 [Ridgeia piscesae]|uniref:Uncharacterized protein n=1 Tax=Ridgeia piscesae TaxID=27915 RepID=A0AAD9MNW6_RIDPI|nr:hypothetical protein NP493_7646g00001 [Ridgeia piscesae]